MFVVWQPHDNLNTFQVGSTTLPLDGAECHYASECSYLASSVTRLQYVKSKSTSRSTQMAVHKIKFTPGVNGQHVFAQNDTDSRQHLTTAVLLLPSEVVFRLRVDTANLPEVFLGS